MEILLIIALTVTLLVLKKIFKLAFLSIPFLMAFMWFFFIYVSIIVFQTYSWQYLSLIWILIGVIVFTLGYGVGERIANKNWAKPTKIEPRYRINLSLLRRALSISIIIGLSYGILKLQSFGFSFGELLSFDKLGEINNSVAVTRYTDGGVYSLFYQFLLSFVYLAPLLGGLLFSHAEKRKDKLLAFFAFAPELLAFSFTNEKATLIVSIIFWAASCIVGFLRKKGRFPRVSLAGFVKGGLLLFFVIIILLYSMMLRLGSIDGDNFNIALKKMENSYALSQVPAFDSVFTDVGRSPLAYGILTFYGISNFLGVAEREQGVYTDSFSHEDIGTNVYTAFRALIGDYGYIGSLFIMCVIGFATAIGVVRIIKKGKVPYLSIALVIAVYSFTLFSFATSLFAYLSLIVALLFYIAILATCAVTGTVCNKVNST